MVPETDCAFARKVSRIKSPRRAQDTPFSIALDRSSNQTYALDANKAMY